MYTRCRVNHIVIEDEDGVVRELRDDAATVYADNVCHAFSVAAEQGIFYPRPQWEEREIDDGDE